jgi:hypothetical protein
VRKFIEKYLVVILLGLLSFTAGAYAFSYSIEKSLADRISNNHTDIKVICSKLDDMHSMLRSITKVIVK